MRAAVVVVLIALLGGALVLVDLGVTAAAEERVAARVGDMLGAPAEVSLEGWPVTVRAIASGEVPLVVIRAGDVPAGGGTIDRLEIRLTGVRFDLADVRDGEGVPSAQEARFEAEVSQDSLLVLLRLPEGVAGISLLDGVARVDVAGLETVVATFETSEGVVVVRPQHPLAVLVGLDKVPVDLSGQPGRPYVEEVEVVDGALLLRGRLEEFDLDSG